MRNESVLTLNDFKNQIINQIKANAPSSDISIENVDIKVIVSEGAEPIDFHSLKVVINI